MSDTNETFEVKVARGHCDTWIDPDTFDDVELVSNHTMARIVEWLEEKGYSYQHPMTALYPTTYNGETTCGYQREFVFLDAKAAQAFVKVWG